MNDRGRALYVSGDTYRARYLVPLDSIPGEQNVEIQLVEGGSAVLTLGSEINIWPADFEQQIGLRQQSAFMPPNRIIRVQREPVNVVGTTRLLDRSLNTLTPDNFFINA